MIFSYNWLQSFFKQKLPKPEKLAEILTLHFAEVEEIRRQEDDFVLDIDVRPNRAGDCFSHMGIAREIAAIQNTKYVIQDTKLVEDKAIRAKDFISVEVKNKNACPRYTARVIANVKVFPSPPWMQKRLRACGLRPINNIVDATNYVMLELGQPLHAFDKEKIKGKDIIVRFARKGEKIITLDGEKYELDKNILVIADKIEPLAIAGIKGGKKAEVDTKTKNIILESANFNPRVVRRGSKTIDLKTDASLRFEHGLDPNLTEAAINRVAFLIQQLSGGKIAQRLVDFYSQKTLPKQIKLDLDYTESLLGVKIPSAKIKNILKSLEFKIREETSREFTVEIPTRRLDVQLPEDLIEEIGRIYGYQRIPSIFPRASLVPSEKNVDIFWEDFSKDILKEAGFCEVYNYSFISENEKDIFDFTKEGLVELENPLSLDLQYLRPSLTPNILKNIERNQKSFKDIKIFELGKVFAKIQNPLEKRMITGVITGDAFYEAKGVVDSLLQKLGISEIFYDQYQPTPEESKISIWRKNRCAEIKINNTEIGFLGEISQKVLTNLKIESKITAFEIDFEKLSKLVSEEKDYRPISRFPSAVRDIAVLLPLFINVEEVLNKIYRAGGNLIRDVDLFDIYEGAELPEGKKNLAFHIIYQAEDRTLSSKEIDELQNKIIKALEEEPDWQVRK